MRFSQDNTDTKLCISKFPEISVCLIFFAGTNFRGSAQKTSFADTNFRGFLENREIREN